MLASTNRSYWPKSESTRGARDGSDASSHGDVGTENQNGSLLSPASVLVYVQRYVGPFLSISPIYVLYFHTSLKTFHIPGYLGRPAYSVRYVAGECRSNTPLYLLYGKCSDYGMMDSTNSRGILQWRSYHHLATEPGPVLFSKVYGSANTRWHCLPLGDLLRRRTPRVVVAL